MDLKLINDALENKGLCVLENLDLNAWKLFQETIKKEISMLDQNSKTLPNNINEVRLNAYRKINEIKDWENLYYLMASRYIDYLLGPDLLIQRKLNLSVQLPKDSTSSLGIHADTLSGQSPFEIVLWAAITDAFDSNGMFYFDRSVSKEIFEQMPKMENSGLSKLKEMYWSKVNFLDVKASQIVIFSGTIFHGNIINATDKTRVSINCRFKNLFSPQTPESTPDRKVGVFYKLFSNSIITDIGKEYLERELKF